MFEFVSLSPHCLHCQSTFALWCPFSPDRDGRRLLNLSPFVILGTKTFRGRYNIRFLSGKVEQPTNAALSKIIPSKWTTCAPEIMRSCAFTTPLSTLRCQLTFALYSPADTISASTEPSPYNMTDVE